MRRRCSDVMLLLALVAASRQCQDCVHMTFHSCWICYENCEQGEVFHNCTQEECGDYYYTSEGHEECSYYVNVTRSQEDCFNSCCENGGPFSQTKIQECKEYNDRSTTILIAVLSSVFGSMFLAGICVCFCVSETGQECRDSCRPCLQRFCYYIRCQCFRRERHAEKKQQPIYETTQKHEFVPGKYEWDINPYPNNELTTEANKCTICFGVEIDTITNCGHYFHLRCLCQWLRRSQMCPLCNGHYNPVKLYCRNCFKNSHYLDMNGDSNCDQMVSEIRGPNCPHCR